MNYQTCKINSLTSAYLTILLTVDRIDFYNAPSVLNELQSILKLNEEAITIFLDFSNIKSIDSSGIGGIINIAHNLIKQSKKLKLINLCSHINRIITLLHVDDLLEKINEKVSE